MGTMIQDYMSKEQQLKKLQEELEAMKDNPSFQRDLEFKDKVQELMRDFGKSTKDVIDLLDPTGELTGKAKTEGGVSSGRRKRKLKVYQNPNTGEVIKTRGGNQKTIKAWKDEHGDETVEGWVIEIQS